MNKHMMKFLWVVPLLALGACQGQRAQQEQAAEEQPATGQEMEMAAATYQIRAQNPMPHAMIVYAKTDSGEEKLGTVPANGSTSFTLTQPGTTDVQLRAVDENQTHEVTETVHLTKGQEATFMIAESKAHPLSDTSQADTSGMN